MIKLKNPFVKYNGYMCFGCAPHNEIGLKMEFYWDKENNKVISFWEPDNHYQGYNYILHGGIQTTLLDEIASWVVFVELDTAGVTSKLEVKFIRPVFTNKGKLKLEAFLLEKIKNIAKIKAILYSSENIIGSEGIFYYRFFPREYAEKHLFYPGLENFLN